MIQEAQVTLQPQVVQEEIRSQVTEEQQTLLEVEVSGAQMVPTAVKVII